THAPAASPAWKTQFHGASVVALKAWRKAYFFCGEAKELLFRSSEQAFAGFVDEAEASFVIEREDGEINFADDGAQEVGGFHGTEALLAQGLAEDVDLAHDFAHGVFAASTASADGEVLLAESSKEVGERL